MDNKILIMLGGGGHAASVAEVLEQQGHTLYAVVSPTVPVNHPVLNSAKHLLNDDAVLEFEPSNCLLINGIGSIPPSSLRADLYEYFINKDYTFLSVVCETAYVSPSALIEDGVQVMPMSVVGVSSRIGSNTIINTGAIVDHHCNIARHCHLATGVKISGNVTVENNVHIGTGANIINNITIGSNSVISVGASVVKDCPSAKTVFPARGTIQ